MAAFPNPDDPLQPPNQPVQNALQPPAQPQQQPQPWYNQNDITTFQNWARQRYGREATPQELQQVGANSTNMQTAQSYADTLARQQGWQGPPAPPAPPPVTGGAGGQQVQSELQRRVLEMLGRNTGQVDTTSQEYQSQLGSFKRGQQSAIERAKRAAAERAAGSGTLHTGGFDASQGLIDTQAAQQLGDYEAGLAGTQIGRQREDLQMALQAAMQGGLANEARQIQERLGSQDLDLRRYLGRGQLGLGMLSTLLGNEQARNALGFNYASLQNQMNQQTLQQLLGGL